jgi:hypothetical protein
MTLANRFSEHFNVRDETVNGSDARRAISGFGHIARIRYKLKKRDALNLKNLTVRFLKV